jgi:1,2-diacylglycerol 3-beta-glucosyltransferase
VVAVLNAFTTLMGVMFLAYVAFILVPFLRHKPVANGDQSKFIFHFFIPCRDEEAVIETTIRRAREFFPQAHVWVIDDDSEDRTADIVTGFADTDSFVHLVQRRRPNARTGKGDALNSAYGQLNAWLPDDVDRTKMIITVIDADGEMAANALDVCSADEIFGDDTVGAAQIAVWMKNRADKKPYPGRGVFANMVARWMLRMQDLEFRTVIAGMQSLRARTGTVGLGGNGQFTRLSTLDAIADIYGEPWHGALLEDYELGVHVLLTGSTIKHVYDTHVSQEALPSVRRLLTQRTRWAQGNIQCVRYIPEIVKSRHFDSAGVVETCYYLVLPFLQMLGAAAFLVLLGLSAAHWISEPTAPIVELDTLAWLAGVSLVFAVAPFALWGPVYKLRCEPDLSWRTAVLYGIGAWLYVYYMYICIARAFWRIARGKNGWSKTRRNAEAHVIVGGSVAVEA